MKPALVGAMAIAVACGAAYGQTADAKLEFEVASIKPAPPPTGMGMRVMTNGGPGTKDPTRFTCENCSLSMLVTIAYDLKRYQFTPPSWMDSERFDIASKIPAGVTKEQFREMVQNMLADRFKLACHKEKKEMQVYELVVAKGGPKLKESEPPPAAPDDNKDPNAKGPKSDDAPPLPPLGGRGPIKMDKDGYPILPQRMGGRSGSPMMIMMNGRARTQATGATMEQLATMLGNQLNKPVVDATGLTGKYDYSLFWAADTAIGPKGGMMPPPPGGGPGGGMVSVTAGPGGGGEARMPAIEGDSGPTLMAAVQQQLGLKLEPKKGTVDIMVVDHMEKVPTEN